MQKKFHIISFILLTAALFTGGFGCTGPGAESIKPITLEYWTVYDDVEAIQKLVAQYKQSRPYLTINIKQMSVRELYGNLVEALAEDKGPDIVSISNRNLAAYQSKLSSEPATMSDTVVSVVQGQFSNQTIITNQTVSGLTPIQLDREYVPAVKKDVVLDGKIYGLPLSLDTMALFYNKDLLNRSGITGPPKTWEEFQTSSKRMVKYDKKTNAVNQAGAALGTGNNIPGSEDLLFILMKQSGVKFTDDNGRAIFNGSPRDGGESNTTRVMRFFTDFADVTKDTYSWNENQPDALQAFENGSLAYYFGYSYDLTTIKSRAPQLSFDVVPMLQLNEAAPINAANYWLQTVTAKSKHKNEAWAFINYLTHSPATKTYLDKSNRPTALRAYINSQIQNPDTQPFVAQVLVAENWYHGNNYEVAGKAINDLIHEWLVPPPDPNRVTEWQQQSLNRAAAKVNQTL